MGDRARPPSDPFVPYEVAGRSVRETGLITLTELGSRLSADVAWILLALTAGACGSASQTVSASPTPAVTSEPHLSPSAAAYRLELRLSGTYSATIDSGSVQSGAADGTGMICLGGAAPITVIISATASGKPITIQIIARDTNVGSRPATVVVVPPQDIFPPGTPGPFGALNFAWTDRVPLEVSPSGSGRLDSDLTGGSYTAPQMPEHIAGGWTCS